VKIARRACWIVIPIFLFAYIFFRGEIVMMLNPKYSEKNLMGLAYTQVIQRLGPPDYENGKTPLDLQDGKPHTQRAIAYQYASCGRTIYFTDGKVDGVKWDR
jgi:hypothetical protein